MNKVVGTWVPTPYPSDMDKLHPGKEMTMSLESDFERFSQKIKRRKYRQVSEMSLKKMPIRHRTTDLAPTVSANRDKAEQKAKLDNLRRS